MRWLCGLLLGVFGLATLLAVPAHSQQPAPAPTPEVSKWFNGKPDPTGERVSAPVKRPGDGDAPNLPTTPELTDRVAHNTISINLVWVMLCGVLVMFMQAGFALVETGLCRSRNAAHTIGMNFMIYPLGCLAFFAYGFALGWGNWYNGVTWTPSLGPGTSLLNEGFGLIPEFVANKPTGGFKYGLFGLKGFGLAGLDDVSVLTMFFFMMVFMDTTATIPTGALAERWAWKNFCLFGLWVALPYCLFANWVWGGGWLAQSGNNWHLGHGAVDFAGSGVVHAMGGAISLAGVLVIGPRIGKYVNGRPQAIPGHNIPMVVLGTFILAFGWFGFNGGSALAGTDLRFTTAMLNTLLGSVAGPIAAMLTLWFKRMKPDPSMLCNGMLAGLVSVTGSCAFIDSWAALFIGAVGGVLVVLAVLFFEDLGLDDPVGALSVHGVGGIWGLIALGLFANGKYGDGFNGVSRQPFKDRYNGVDGVRGLFYGDASQLAAQLLDAGVVVIFGFLMAYVWFKFADRITPMRVSSETEMRGLDVPEMGALAYPTDVVPKNPTMTG